MINPLDNIPYTILRNFFFLIFFKKSVFLLYKILIHKNLATTNALWNVVSIVLVSFIGVYYFGEPLNIYSKIGIVFAILSIIFIEFNNIKLLFK